MRKRRRHLGIARKGGGSKPLPGWFGATFLERICLIWGGLDPCPDGLGHFFRDEVPQSARLSAGGGAKAIWAMPK